MEDYIKLQAMASKLDEHTYDVFARENSSETTTITVIRQRQSNSFITGIEEFKQES